MRELISGDFHLRNDRIEDAAYTLEVLGMVAKEKNVKSIVIVGDLGHTDSWGAALMDVIECGLGSITREGISITIIGGNHDLDKHGNFTIGILSSLRGVQTVVEPDTNGYAAYIPFSKDMEGVLQGLRSDKNFKRKRVMFFHCGFKGGKVGGADWVPKADISAGKVKKWFEPDMIIAGHYHKPQWFYKSPEGALRGGYYVGSPRQHTFGEEGENKRMILITDNILINIPLKDYFSEHITLRMEKAGKIPIWKSMKYDSNRVPIYRIIVPRPEWVSSVRKLWGAYKGRWSIVSEKTGSVEEHGAIRSDIRPTDSYSELVNKYVEHKQVLGGKKLVKIGMEIVEAAQ